MKCPQCEAVESKVIESRDLGDGSALRRRRVCNACEHRFTTYERIERPQLMVVKNGGKDRQLFDRNKILNGLNRAIEKRPVSALQVEAMVSDIERSIYSEGEAEVSTQQIGEMVMDRLARLDDVAYVRFASVYRRFKDLSSFEQELKRLKKRPKV